MTLRVSLFKDEYEALGTWTGETREELLEHEGHHEGPREIWLAWDGDRVVGVLRPWRRPDGRHFLYFGPCEPAAYPALVARIEGECYTGVDGADEAALAEFTKLGFRIERTENRYTIPVAPVDAPIPAGLEIVSAGGTELELLMGLDCALRQEVPDAEGWQPDPVWFREETYDSPYFDPEAYLVALDGAQYVGLVRIWNGPAPLPNLGMVGVLPAYRRRGLAKALIGQAFGALHARGTAEVTTEAETGDAAMTAILARLGGVVIGSQLELRRP